MENIDAFPMWEVFNKQIIPALLDMAFSDATLQRLTSVIKTTEFLKIIAYTRDPSTSWEEYQKKTLQYKAFTIWLLERCFYLLTCDNFAKIHDLVFNVHIRILHYISISQPDLYTELCGEYFSCLTQLNRMHCNDSKKIRLEIFMPIEIPELKDKLDFSAVPIEVSSKTMCSKIQMRVLKLLSNMLLNIKSSNLHEVIYDNFDCLEFVLSECSMDLKLSAIDVYVTALNCANPSRLTSGNVPLRYSNFVSFLENIVCNVYNKTTIISQGEMQCLESLLIVIFSSPKHFNNCMEKLYHFALYINAKAVSKDLQFTSLSYVRRNQLPSSDNVKEYINRVVNCKEYEYFKFVKEQIQREKGIELWKTTWYKLYFSMFPCLPSARYANDMVDKTNDCKFLDLLTTAQKFVKLTNELKVEDYEHKSWPSVLDLFRITYNHFSTCNKIDSLEILMRKFITDVYCVGSFDLIFNAFSFPFTNKGTELLKYEWKPGSFWTCKSSRTLQMALTFLCTLVCNCSSRHTLRYTKSTEQIRHDYFRIIKSHWRDVVPMLPNEVVRNVLRYPTMFNGRDEWITDVLVPALETLSPQLLPIAIEVGGEIICQSSSQFVHFISSVNDETVFEVCCLSCRKEYYNVNEKYELETILEKSAKSQMAYAVSKPVHGNCETVFRLLKHILKHCASNDSNVKISIIKTMHSFTHLLPFYDVSGMSCWFKFADDRDVMVRREFSKVVKVIFVAISESKVISNEDKNEMFKTCFLELQKYSEQSVHKSNYELQETLLTTISELSKLSLPITTRYVSQILLYFIMYPTSKHYLIALNIFMEMAHLQNTTTALIYAQHRQQLCSNIMKICAINLAVIGYSLSTSLERISTVLGFYGPKDFVMKESRSLLPVLISMIVIMPQVERLVEEFAKLEEMSVKDLLISKYGNIFLHIFLNETEDMFKRLMRYIEEKTGCSGRTLRKKDLLVILSDLLLNFHEYRDRVLVGLRILATDDSDGPPIGINRIPEYLQPKLLGVLGNFDMKLVLLRYLDVEKVLLSLAELVTFMGPKYITPLRFKIFAMLKTALNSNEVSGQLHCDVWEAFLKSCEIESLGPQLASIFVFLIPLLENQPKVTAIFRYLIIEKEAYVKDYICDLFFLLEGTVGGDICVVIEKYLKRVQGLPFREHLSAFLKYLNHETVEIRVHGLKYIKRLLETNREELDRMILGYNGIDPIIVSLLDVLMLACRDKEDLIKLACGECLGELGAIEPSHLPRQYKTETQSFIFFITEDSFIVSALNELTRALQAEKNTRKMDRFALAIQEALKYYEISPDPSSRKHKLWMDFPDSQKELMLPMLSSRYTLLQPKQKIPVSPIYGSKYGSTYDLWISNWTSNLTLEMKVDERSVVQVCLPSLHQDHNTLMVFLPHILLHALLDGSQASHDDIFAEFTAVIDTYTNREASVPIASLPSGTPISSNTVSPEEKVVFVLLDFLDRWIREWTWKGPKSANEEECRIIKSFLTRFCKLKLARSNCRCGEYARALMYFEEYISEHSDQLKNHLPLFTELYAQLDEPDGVEGVTTIHDKEPPIEQKLLALEVSGKLTDAIAHYEQIPAPLKLHHLQCLVQCYLDLENVHAALNYVRGYVHSYPTYNKNVLLEMQAEPLLRLGRYSDLDELLKKPEMRCNHSWSLEVGRSLLYLQDGKMDEFNNILNSLSISQVDALGAASLKQGAYQHGYMYAARLHTITELKQIGNMIKELLLRPNDHKVCESVLKKLMVEWELRLKIVHQSRKIQESILSLRRVGILQAKTILRDRVPNSLNLLNSILGESWLRSATIARASGVHQQAFTYTLKADDYSPPRLFLEKAQLHWMREEHQQALSVLRKGVERLIPDAIGTPSFSCGNNDLDIKKISAEAKLLIASYNDSVSNVDAHVNKQHYKDAVDNFNQWEKSLVCLAQYYDRLSQSLPDSEREKEEGDMKVLMINYFGRSLLYGSEYVYQSMPRMLSIWFDYGTGVSNLASGITVSKSGGIGKMERENTLTQMTNLIDTFLERLPSYIFLTAFSQIVSRICHPQKQVSIELRNIIVKLVLQYPQQTLWMLISMIKSRCAIRLKRCTEILKEVRSKSSNMGRLIGDFTKLAEKLIELCNKEIPDNIRVASVGSVLQSLPRMLSNSDFSEIMIPTQKFRKLILPNPDFQSSQHNPFPNRYVHIVGIEDKFTILESMQHPRKITFRGSDGNKYTQLLKPKDDLRKDFRLMEFNDVVNQMLSRDPDCRQRRLHIRLYSVVPLNEECGILEWIHNLVGLRPVLQDLYKQRGLGMSGRDIKNVICNQNDSLAKKRDVFTKCLLPRNPPIFKEWFRKTFPDAQSWLTARTAYIHTTAAISMVGYVLGLGDRHGENISFDSTCGDTVHVDFNCLFNKGETFQWPERVPFRLTHNMVAAMGPLGVEGMFRKSCACTLTVLRAHTNTLMSIVAPFVYDPLVSWSRRAVPNMNVGEQPNLQAVEHLANIEERLKGIIKSKRKSTISIPLSVDGQTNILIQEAMSIDNLCQMYIGWGAYL
ncbi:hypothetical protein PPYR_13489 [Photinus pyralis]|uniref:Serine/threonine-protein kinase ATR n=3 Tax=Photinus pyralis TaxID=7054 RepID=A0A5N4A9A0_PHOPY|nr:serine/threonine-protein kinase ATR-like [Photinus pyralis]KAB0793869.1 hypothetical protein PPYR_13489 [Photinus pyralis]